MHRINTSPNKIGPSTEMGHRREFPTLTEIDSLINHSQKKIVSPRESHWVYKTSAHKHVCKFREVKEAG